MARYRITTPVVDYTGLVADVAFAHGAAEADLTASQVAYFSRHGYRMRPAEAPQPATDTEPAPERPAKSASKATWVSYWVALGGDQAAAEALTRDQLADLTTAPTSSEGDKQ